MDVGSDGCRLCLDPFAHNVQSIDIPELKEQLEKVFHFPITIVEGYPNSVCQSCTYTISEFYQFSEKVRRNQEELSGESRREACIESKVTIEDSEIESFQQWEGTDHVPQEEPNTEQEEPLLVEHEKPSTLESFGNHDERLNQGQLTVAESSRDMCIQSEFMPEAESRSSDCVEFNAVICTPQKDSTAAKLALDDQEKPLRLQDHNEPSTSVTFTERKRRLNLKKIKEVNTSRKKFIQSREMIESESSDCVEFDAEVNTSREESTSPLTFVKHEKPLILEAVSDDEEPPSSEIFANNEELSDSDTTLKQNEVSDENHDSDEHYKPYFDRTKKRQNKKHEIDEFSPRNKSPDTQQQEYKKIHEFYQMVCDLCGHQAPTFNQLLTHFRVAHGRPGYAVCCGKKLLNSRFLLEHMTLHANPSAFKCKLCGKNFASKAYLGAHHTKVHEKNRPFRCDRCPKSFAAEYLLRSHMVAHNKIQCPMCDKQLASQGALQNHLAALHGDKNQKISCGSCDKEFSSNFGLDRHMKTHTDVKGGEKTKCHVCNVWLPSEPELIQHMKSAHEMVVKNCHVCPVCRTNCPSLDKLDEHKLVMHGKRRFECEFCGMKFNLGKNLKEHRTTHRGQTLHTCYICAVKLTSEENMHRHIQSQHPVEWAQQNQNATQDEEIIIIS